MREVFETLSRRGGKLALATDCKGPELKHYPSLLHIDEFIGAKPDPRIVGVALRKLGLTGHEAVMIGDTPYDDEAASRAGGGCADPAGLAPMRYAGRLLRGCRRNLPEAWRP